MRRTKAIPPTRYFSLCIFGSGMRSLAVSVWAVRCTFASIVVFGLDKAYVHSSPFGAHFSHSVTKHMALLRPQFAFPSTSTHHRPSQFQQYRQNLISCLPCCPTPPNSMEATETDSKAEYNRGIFDDLFLNLFRNKMVKEVGWNSNKPGYDGLIEVANHLVTRRSNSETREAAVRILISLFPPFLLELYRMLITPIGGGKVAAMMVARVTVLTCQWLMGPCAINSVNLPSGSSWRSGVFVERCKYLEESKCIGICINTCKLPTQAFFEDHMGIPLLMEPNFSDYSCQFNFGIAPPLPEDDITLKESCLEVCPNASRRREGTGGRDVLRCPKA